jgi:hypothetical protein
VPAAADAARTAGVAVRWDGADLVLHIQVQPRASRNELAGIHGDRLKVRLTAPPVDGRANAALIAFLAELFGVSRSCVTLLAGETGRAKRVRIKRPARLPAGLGRPAAGGN